jgi:hypothetical protein
VKDCPAKLGKPKGGKETYVGETNDGGSFSFAGGLHTASIVVSYRLPGKGTVEEEYALDELCKRCMNQTMYKAANLFEALKMLKVSDEESFEEGVTSQGDLPMIAFTATFQWKGEDWSEDLRHEVQAGMSCPYFQPKINVPPATPGRSGRGGATAASIAPSGYQIWYRCTGKVELSENSFTDDLGHSLLRRFQAPLMMKLKGRNSMSHTSEFMAAGRLVGDTQ